MRRTNNQSKRSKPTDQLYGQDIETGQALDARYFYLES